MEKKFGYSGNWLYITLIFNLITMECQVCKHKGISETTEFCPECRSDLRSLIMLEKIGKINRNRFYAASVLAGLLIITLVVWVVASTTGSRSENGQPFTDNNELMMLKETESRLRSQNELLLSENREMKAELELLKAKKEAEYFVKEGETLFMIARKVFGNGFMYTEIAASNNISDANNIVAGQKLIIYY